MKSEIRKRKELKCRCPFCDSSQVRNRKLLKNWKCQRCGKTFKNPKSDLNEV